MNRLIAFLVMLISQSTFSQSIQFPGPGTPHSAGSGPTYTYEAAESGSCSKVVASLLGQGTSCNVVITATPGDVLAINCVTLGNSPFGDAEVSFLSTSETPSDMVDLSPNDPTSTFGDSSGWTVVLGGSGSETIYCNSSLGSGTDNPGGLGIGNMVAMTVDAWNSSTGWFAVDSGTPAYVLAPAAGTCTVNAALPTNQANELVYGSCFATAGTASSATGYTIAQNDPFTSIGQSLTAYKGITSIQTPSFVTNGTLTDPQSLIMTFEPN